MARTSHKKPRFSARHAERLDASQALSEQLVRAGVGEQIERCGHVAGSGWVVVARADGDVAAVIAAVPGLRLREPGRVLVDAAPENLLFAVLHPRDRSDVVIRDNIADVTVSSGDKRRVTARNAALLFLATRAAAIRRINLLDEGAGRPETARIRKRGSS